MSIQNVNITDPNGVLIINKHSGVSSHDIVNKVRRLYGTKKVGHAGTLDPLATGVLVVLIGRAAKASEYLMGCDKIYRAGLRLGITTDTEDITGNMLTSTDDIPSEDAVTNAARGFIGKTEQIPPMYSALKVGGQKLYDLARAGKVVERKPRPIEIFSLDIAPTDDEKEYTITVACSGGTYIRTLCADIGNVLKCGGVMSSLERLEACGYPIEASHTISELEEMDMDARLSLLMPIETLFAELPGVKLNDFFERLCRSGCVIYQKKLGTSLPCGERVRICDKSGHFFALGEVREFDEGSAIKAIKLFEL